ncbi:MAG: FAD:protein FMN transferase [Planctomycetia bacterium]|nr:FAD:protein FMN transferase [Planctomycetia bacterium]
MQPPRPATRRHFITGQAAVAAMQDVATNAALRGDTSAHKSPFEPFDGSEQPYYLRYTRQAMASDFQLLLPAGENRVDVALEALDLLEPLEAQLTVYRDTSEVLDINRRAADVPVEVESQLFALLELAVQLHRDTAGAYDITSGPLSQAWGFARRQGAVPDAETLAAARAQVGSEKLLLDRRRRTVRFTQPGVQINFNSLGKGYALDRCGSHLRAAGFESFLWHGGQSSVLAQGSAQAESSAAAPPGPDSPGWMIGIGHPLRPERKLAELLVRDRAAGTSGAGFQFFRHAGKRYGHILDPRTGTPAEGVFSVTVLAPTAALADALSTAFYVLGFDESVRYCQDRPEIGFLMLLPAESGSAVELAVCGLDDDCWRLAAS